MYGSGILHRMAEQIDVIKTLHLVAVLLIENHYRLY